MLIYPLLRYLFADQRCGPPKCYGQFITAIHKVKFLAWQRKRLYENTEEIVQSGYTDLSTVA